MRALVFGERRVSGLEERDCTSRVLAGMLGPPDRCVLLGELLVEPAVGLSFALGPGDGLLEEWNRFLRSAERSERLADRIPRDLDGRRVRRVALPRTQRPLEGIECECVVGCFVVLPAKVVEQRPEPVGGAFALLREVDPSLRPGDEALAIGCGKRGHVRGVAGDEVLIRP